MWLTRAAFVPIFLTLFSVAHGETNSTESSRRSFKLTVIVLTMNRPRSLARLLKSLEETDFEDEADFFDTEIHVDKSIGAHYDDCVKYERYY